MRKINDITKFIKDYVESAKASGVLVAMSGGKDSFIVAKLATMAVGSENVFGLIMPNGKMKDIDVAKEECEYLNIKYAVANIEKLYDNVILLTKKSLNMKKLSDVTTINTAPRLRMTMAYSAAASLNYLVANTSNLSETMIGYSTKWGDNVGDFAPIASLTKTEVCKLGLDLGLPENYIMKKPDDGLSGKTDEEKIGFSYDELDNFIRKGKKGDNFNRIERMHKISEHKRMLPKKYDSKLKNYFDN